MRGLFFLLLLFLVILVVLKSWNIRTWRSVLWWSQTKWTGQLEGFLNLHGYIEKSMCIVSLKCFRKEMEVCSISTFILGATHVCTHVHRQTRMHACTCTKICTQMHARARIHAKTHAHMHEHTHACKHAHTCETSLLDAKSLTLAFTILSITLSRVCWILSWPHAWLENVIDSQISKL